MHIQLFDSGLFCTYCTQMPARKKMALYRIAICEESRNDSEKRGEKFGMFRNKKKPSKNGRLIQVVWITKNERMKKKKKTWEKNKRNIVGDEKQCAKLRRKKEIRKEGRELPPHQK